MFTQVKTPSIVQLRAGQSLRQYCPSVTVIFVREGKVSFSETPAWLGDQFLPRNATLVAEEVYVVQDAGWNTLHACSTAEVLLQHPSKGGRLAEFLIRTTWSYLRRYLPPRLRRN
jgi:hypothetical protein